MLDYLCVDVRIVHLVSLVNYLFELPSQGYEPRILPLKYIATNLVGMVGFEPTEFSF